MLDGGDATFDSLPQNLQTYIKDFDTKTATEIDLSLENLTEGNIALFLKLVTEKYSFEEKPQQKKFISLSLANVPVNLKEKANEAHVSCIEKVINDWVYYMDVSDSIKREEEKNTAKLNNVASQLGAAYEQIENLEDEQQKVYREAFDKAIIQAFESMDSKWPCLAPVKPSGKGALGKKIKEMKHRYVLDKAKKEFEEKGLGLPQQERENYDTGLPEGQSLLSYVIGYAAKKGFVARKAEGNVLEDQTYNEYREWLAPLVKQEAIMEMALKYDLNLEDYDLENQADRRKFFMNAYGGHYAQRIKNQSTGQIRFFPEGYSSEVHPKEMIKAGFDFLALGAFKNNLGEVIFELKKPSDPLDFMKVPLDSYLDPMIEHVQAGRPLPFTNIKFKHPYGSEDVLDKAYEIAKAIADRPQNYPKLSNIEFDWGEMDIKLDKYDKFLDKMIELAKRQENPLRTAIDLAPLNKKFIKAFESYKAQVEGVENPNPQILEAYEKSKAIVDKITEYRGKVNQNRREQNYHILINGEESLSQMKGYEPPGGSVKTVDSWKQVRPSKRNTSLDSALRNAGVEQEMEEQEAQEKSQEKEQEKEQEQQQQQDVVIGNESDNLCNYEQFRLFVRELITYSVSEEQMKRFYHGLCGNYQAENDNYVQNPNIRAVSKEAVRTMLRDPDHFQSGLVDGNLPKGFHFGTLATNDGPLRGIYFDSSLEDANEEDPLTIKFQDPVPKRSRLKADPDHFKVKDKLSAPERAAIRLGQTAPGGLPDNLLDPPTRDEIEKYNKGQLFGIDGWMVAGKMAFCTSKKLTVMQYREWYNDPITKSLQKSAPPQEIAEQSVALGGDAIFELTKRLNKVKKRAKQVGQEELFDAFLDNFILQKDNQGWLEKPKFCDHIIRHDQFAGMEKISQLDENDFKFFMAFFNQHAKYHTAPNLNELYNNFQYFKQEFNKIAPNHELPTDNLNEFATTCTDMKVGLDRTLQILQNAKANNQLNTQLEVLTKLDLNYAASYSAMQHCQYRVILPEMRTDKEYLKKSILSKKSNISALQTAAFFNHFNFGMDTDKLQVELYRQFAIVDNPPKLSELKALDEFIQGIKKPDYENPEQVRAFLYTFAGYTCFHENGLADVNDFDKLEKLAKTVDGLPLHVQQQKDIYAKFFSKLSECQIDYFTCNEHTPPTIDSLNTYIQTIQRLSENKHFIAEDVERNSVLKAFDPSSYFENASDLFEPIHQLSKKSGGQEHKLTDRQLAHILVQLETNSKLTQQEENPKKQAFSKLQSGLLHALCLIEQPDENFIANQENNKSLSYFINDLQDNVCVDNEIGYNCATDVLKVLQNVKWEQVEQPYPTFEQLKSLIKSAETNPKPNYEAVSAWIKEQAGFELMSFDVSKIEQKEIQSASYNTVFEGQKENLIKLIEDNYEDIQIDREAFASLSEFLQYLDTLNLTDQADKFATKVFPTLASVYYQAVESGKKSIQEPENLPDLNQYERERMLAIIENNYNYQSSSVNTWDELLEEAKSARFYFSNIDALSNEINQTKKVTKGQFKGISALLMKYDLKQVSVTDLGTLLRNLHEDAAQSHVYKKEILATVLKYPNLLAIDQKWDSVNNIIKNQVLPSQGIDLEATTELLLNVASIGPLQSNDVNKLLSINEKNPDTYKTLVNAINKIIESGQTLNLGQVSQKVTDLLEKGIEEEKLNDFLATPDHIQLLTDVAIIESLAKQKSIVDIIIKTQETSQDPSIDSLKELMTALKGLSEQALKTLATMEIDATYPNVSSLLDGVAKISQEETYTLDSYIEDLQKDFFAMKNDPKTLDMIFSDDRVIDVLNESKTLAFKDPQHLMTGTKDKLLGEYAYIHALGFNKPLHNGKPAKDLTKQEIKDLTQILKQKMRDKSLSEEDRYLATLQMIALSREVYYRASLPEIRFPYSTQVISLLTALHNGDMNINQISTGQGKSLTAALYSTIMWAKGQPTVVCTSNLTLASEGLEENQSYYDYMGIPTALVRAQSDSHDFVQDGINYSDVSNLALFLAKSDIKGDFELKNPGLVLDEVDFTVLDEVTDFRYAVNLKGEGFDSEENLDEWIYYKLNEFVDSKEFTEALVDSDSDVTNAIAFLERQLKEDEEQGLVKGAQLEYLRDRLIGFKAPNSDERKQLDTWIDSAQNAKVIYKDGRNKEWTMETYDYKGEEYQIARIISHHRVSKGSKWSKGVHQFLHARINQNIPQDSPEPRCRIDVEKSHVAALSSKNFVDYFSSRGGSIWGMTGTVGSSEERAELQKRYGFKMAEIETHQRRTAQDKPAIVVKGPQEHINSIYKNYKKYWQERDKMPTVIFEENAEVASQFKKSFLEKMSVKAAGFEPPPPPVIQFYNGIEYEVFEYNRQEHAYQKRDISSLKLEEMSTEEKEDHIKQQAGIQNTITITTPMMGRGTDFKPVMKETKPDGSSIKHKHGLFVLQAYAESSLREERQIKGRMGRQGQAGLYMNIIDNHRLISKLESQGIDVPKGVKHFKVKRLFGKLPKYKKSKNMNLAKDRRLKQTYGDIRGHFYKKFIGLVALGNEDKRFNEIAYILGDREDFDPAKFRKDYNKLVLNLWNRFLINMDKKFTDLRDECNGDYEQIFAKLQDECYKEWNNKLIKQLRDNMNLNEDEIKLEADSLFAEFREFKDDELETFATLMHFKEQMGQERERLEHESSERESVREIGLKNLEEMKQLTTDPDEQLMIDLIINDPVKQDEYLAKMYPKHQKGKLAKQQFESMSKDEKIDVIRDVVKPEKYQDAFEQAKYSSVMMRIVESGREALVQDPQSAYRNNLEREFINYAKHYWMRDPSGLTQLDDPKAEISSVIAMDSVDAIYKLHDKLAHDKLIHLDTKTPFEILGIENPYPSDNNRANKYLAKYIQENPKEAYVKLNSYFMNKCITAQMLSQDTKLKSTQYVQLFYQYHRTQIKLLDKLEPLNFADNNLISNFREEFNKYADMNRMRSVKTMVKTKRSVSPSEALDMQIQNSQIHYAPYPLESLKEDISKEIDEYLADKSKMFKRKALAKSLKKEINNCQNMNEILEVIRQHRKSAIATDVKKSSIFRTRNVKGSRFQELLNHSEERAIISAQNPISLLQCANHVRKELIDQFNYISGVLGDKVDIFADLKKDFGLNISGEFEDIKLNDLNRYIEGLDEFIQKMQDDPTQLKTKEAKIGFALLKSNLDVLIKVRDKMKAKNMDFADRNITVSDNENTMVQKMGLTSISSYLATITATKPDMLSKTTLDTERLNLFSQDDLLVLPVEAFGNRAKLFQGMAQNEYETRKTWAPPISEQGIEQIYKTFDELDKDLTSEPEWDQFWALHKSNLIKDGMTQENATQRVEALQQQVLSAYRYQVINNTHFLKRRQRPKETDNEYQLREARCRTYLQQVNRLKVDKNAKQCYDGMKQSYTQKLTTEVEKAKTYYDTLLKQKRPLSDVVPMMDKKLQRFKSSQMFQYLGADGEAIYQSLDQKHLQYQAFLELVNNELNSIAAQFVPDTKEDVHDRVINLIGTAVDKITDSELYKQLDPEIAETVLKSHLTSVESIQRMYQGALEARTEYFRELVPEKFDTLISSKDQGFQWITYPRARREAITNIAQMILSGQIEYHKEDQRLEHYTQCQQLFIAAVEEDIKIMQRDHAVKFVERIKDHEMLKAPSGLSTKERRQWNNQVKEQLVKWKEMAAKQRVAVGVPKPFDAHAHTGMDISVGLLQELEKTMSLAKQDVRDRQVGLKPPQQPEVAQSDSTVPQRFEEPKDDVDEALMKAEQEVYFESEHYTMADLENMMFDEKQHDKVSHFINNISDLDERLAKIEKLFNEAVKGVDDVHVAAKYSQLFRTNYNSNQSTAIRLLQTLYTDAVMEQAIQMANHYADQDNTHHLPEGLSDEGKSEIYNEILGPALEHRIINASKLPVNEKGMRGKLKDLVKEIDSLPCEMEAKQQSTMGLR